MAEQQAYNAWQLMPQVEKLPFGRGEIEVYAKKVAWYPRAEDPVTGEIEWGKVRPMLVSCVLENGAGYRLVARMQVVPRGTYCTLIHPPTYVYPTEWVHEGERRVLRVNYSAQPVEMPGERERGMSPRELLARLVPMLGQELAERVLAELENRVAELQGQAAKAAEGKAKKGAKKAARAAQGADAGRIGVDQLGQLRFGV